MIHTLRSGAAACSYARDYLHSSFFYMPTLANSSPITRIFAVNIAESTSIGGCSGAASPAMSRSCKDLTYRFSSRAVG